MHSICSNVLPASGEAAIIITHFLLVGGAPPYTKLVYLFATNRPQVSVDSGGERLQHRYPTILLTFCVSLTAVASG